MKRKTLKRSTAETNGAGREASGRFGAGNKFGLGRPQSQVQKLREAIVACVTPEDVVGVIQKLVQLAKSGDVNAAKVLLDRAVGRVPFAVIQLEDDVYDPDEKFA